MDFVTQLTFSLIGGVVPALVWLWFWLKEDKKNPEPTGRLIATFSAGMVTVLVVLPLEVWVRDIFTDPDALLFAWVVIEEVLKFVAVFLVAFRHPAFNEPIDAPIYMLTAALGFAALENVLFILSPMQQGMVWEGLLYGNYRFIGATLLHVLASSVVGVCLALVYYKRPVIRGGMVLIGLCIAIALHAGFNYLIIESNALEIFATFVLVWMAVIVLLLLFERIKYYTRQHYASQT